MTLISVAFSLLCIFYEITSSFAFVFEDCGSEIGKFNEISISDCDVSNEKCLLAREQDIHASIKFTPSKDISDVTVHAFGVLLDVPIPVPLEIPDLCNDPNSDLKCPLKKDQEAEYKFTFNLEKNIPLLSIDLMGEFMSEKNEKIVCVKFPVKII